MPSTVLKSPLSEIGQKAQEIYSRDLCHILEPKFGGQAVAIHVDSKDYAIGRTHREAARLLLARHTKDGKIVTITIGPPTEADSRFLGIAERP